MGVFGLSGELSNEVQDLKIKSIFFSQKYDC